MIECGVEYSRTDVQTADAYDLSIIVAAVPHKTPN